MNKQDVDYSLYLVTDSTPEILGDRGLVDVVEAALKGGVTCVQYRDKRSDTAVLISTAKQLHQVTQKYKVPLLINDRLDVALAVGCEGVHIGQDDMNARVARKLLGEDLIIGVTASNPEEAIQAYKDGADYLGIGTVYATPTKTDTKSIIGTDGVRQVLQFLTEANCHVKTVCIGGMNASNVQTVVFKTGSSERNLDGVAVVSAIMAASDPEHEARKLLGLVKSLPPFRQDTAKQERKSSDVRELLALAPGVVKLVAEMNPLSHNMTNLVVQNFAANVALAVGASPIMSNNAEEAADLAKLGGALVINMGTVTADSLTNYVKALKAYNAARQPVIFDPVGAGATAVRKAAVKTIMTAGYIDVIKGNEGEITTVYGETDIQQKGVDSSSTLSPEDKAALVRALAKRERNVVLMTGKTDYISNGERTFSIENGHEYLGMVTGTGCVLGTAISASTTIYPGDRLAAVVAGLLHFEIAAEIAAVRPDVQGPGTFMPAFIDELYRIRKSTADGELKWLSRAKVVKL